ncbi:MAG: DUF3696 domain-containing protein [Candidatus Nanopelagicales bacterium]|nr:DUF3696 domain-containing protein [Candidatus Nanopelagicales bacterium]
MLVRHLTIGGLRSFREQPTQVDLAPLTLVFGPNSAGKSSLLSVLPMLQQTSARPEILNMSGDLVEGGTFRMAVHRHDDTIPMTLGFGWTTREGGEHSGSGEFRWDPSRRVAVRTRFHVDEGGGQAHIDGPRPWGNQPAAAIARRLAPEFYEVLDRIFFVGPIRARSERTTALGVGHHQYVGPAGEHMAELLTDRPDVLDAVNGWCARMELGYRVRMLGPMSNDLVMSAGDFAVLALEDVRHDPPVLVSERAVGYGIGQLLPIVTQCLATLGGMIIVEQPEVHIHPRLQASLGDLFVDTVVGGRAQLLIETHSEHLILRILRLVRDGLIEPSQVAVLYVDLHDDGASFVRHLEVDSDGDLADGWPGGFFDERLADVLPSGSVLP